MMKVIFILVLVPMYDVSEYDVSTCTGVYMYVICMYRLKYMYQCIRTNPILIDNEGKNKMYLES